MASFGKVIGDSLKRLLFRELTVTRLTHLSEHFERVDFASDALRGVRFAPGDKLQVSFDGGPRTYTPFHFDSVSGSLSILVYLHGDGPSARWAKELKQGDRAFAFGPRSSLELASATSPIALFGDETSFGLARALREAGNGASGSPACSKSLIRTKAGLYSTLWTYPMPNSSSAAAMTRSFRRWKRGCAPDSRTTQGRAWS